MPVTDPTGTVVVDLSRAEQWVLHHVLLDALDLADGEPNDLADRGERPRGAADATEPSLTVIEKVESGSFAFTPAELAFIHRACGTHAQTTEAAADRNLASAVARRVEAVIGDSSAPRA